MPSLFHRIQPGNLALLSLLLVAPLASSLQVTPNSPCASVCVDSRDLDFSDPNSSRTRGSDIVCKDKDLESPKGTKWKDCLSCLQTSGFSQGSESDQSWFLCRYSLSYCIFAFPNATGVQDSPCKTSMACGPLEPVLKNGVLDPSSVTAYSYCSAGDGAGTRHIEYDHCSQCVGFGEEKTDTLINYLVALEAGCQQQPKPGRVIALSDTIFAPKRISIADPTTVLNPTPADPGLPIGALVGIAVAGIAVIIIIAAVSFVCYRKRKNRRARADYEAKYYAGHNRHGRNSSLSFQCQTHMASPRHWPGAQGPLSPVDEIVDIEQKPPPSSHSSLSKQTRSAEDLSWESPYQPSAPATNFSRGHRSANNSGASLPLHQITTSVPTYPPNVFASPSSETPSESAIPMSAVSARSTTALLPGFRPYVPADHGTFHGSPQSQTTSTFESPASGTTASPLLKSQTWQGQKQQQRSKNFSPSASTSTPPPPPGPPPPKVPRIALPKMNGPRKPAIGTPVDSSEIRTAFSGPPKK